MRTIRKFVMISVVVAVLLCGVFLSPWNGAAVKASAEENVVPPAELIVDFESDENSTELNGDATITNGKAVLKNGGSVTAKEKFLSFRLYVSVKITGNFKISFGNVTVICGENGFSAQGAAVTYTDKKEISGDVLISLTVMGGRIEAGIRRDGEPRERLYETAFKAVIVDGQTNAVATSFSAESGTAEMSYFEIFSLEASVPTESEDYDPSHDSSAIDVKPLKEKTAGCSGNLQNCVGEAAMAAVGVCITAFGRKKVQKNKNRGKK